MTKAFVDTAAWIALLNINDGLHAEARAKLTELVRAHSHLITSEFVLVELGDGFCSRSVRMQTVSFVANLRQVSYLTIVPVSERLTSAGWEFYEQRPDKDWSLTDCISFVVMKEERISQAFTADHHFEQAGFAKLL